VFILVLFVESLRLTGCNWLWLRLGWDTWGGGETALCSGGGQGSAIVSPDVQVFRTGAGEAVFVASDESFVIARIASSTEGDGTAFSKSALGYCNFYGLVTYRNCRGTHTMEFQVLDA